MIPIEKQVCSLELAQKLKELGVKKKSIFTWGIGGDKCEKEWTVLLTDDDSWSATETYLAFTVAELGIMLPDECGTVRDFDLGFTVWCYQKNDDGNIVLNHYHTTDTEADARAKMLIYMIENGILKAEDL